MKQHFQQSNHTLRLHMVEIILHYSNCYNDLCDINKVKRDGSVPIGPRGLVALESVRLAIGWDYKFPPVIHSLCAINNVPLLFNASSVTTFSLEYSSE